MIYLLSSPRTLGVGLPCHNLTFDSGKNMILIFLTQGFFTVKAELQIIKTQNKMEHDSCTVDALQP